MARQVRSVSINQYPGGQVVSLEGVVWYHFVNLHIYTHLRLGGGSTAPHQYYQQRKTLREWNVFIERERVAFPEEGIYLFSPDLIMKFQMQESSCGSSIKIGIACKCAIYYYYSSDPWCENKTEKATRFISIRVSGHSCSSTTSARRY